MQLINISLSAHNRLVNNFPQCTGAWTATLLPATSVCPCPLHPCPTGSRVRTPSPRYLCCRDTQQHYAYNSSGVLDLSILARIREPTEGLLTEQQTQDGLSQVPATRFLKSSGFSEALHASQMPAISPPHFIHKQRSCFCLPSWVSAVSVSTGCLASRCWWGGGSPSREPRRLLEQCMAARDCFS